MPTFLNLNPNVKTPTGFLVKHLIFAFIWAICLAFFVFRLDVILLKGHPSELILTSTYFPLFYVVILLILLFNQKWYYSIAFMFYPVLVLFWFMPKTILFKGKLYLFISYITGLYLIFANFKRSISTFCIFWIVLLLLFSGENWSRWVALAFLTYLFLAYFVRTIVKAFKRPGLFDSKIEEKIRNYIDGASESDSFKLHSYIHWDSEKNLEIEVQRTNQIQRILQANCVLTLLANKLKGSAGKRAFLLSNLLKLFIFFVITILFFWFANYQLYMINHTNFNYTGNNYPKFDFFYYTVKTVVFGDIEFLKPISILARIAEIGCFAINGVLLLIIFVHIIHTMMQEKVEEDIELAETAINIEVIKIKEFLQSKFGLSIQTAIAQTSNSEESLRKLSNFINKII